jgi:hypothetical protein
MQWDNWLTINPTPEFPAFWITTPSEAKSSSILRAVPPNWGSVETAAPRCSSSSPRSTGSSDVLGAHKKDRIVPMPGVPTVTMSPSLKFPPACRTRPIPSEPNTVIFGNFRLILVCVSSGLGYVPWIVLMSAGLSGAYGMSTPTWVTRWSNRYRHFHSLDDTQALRKARHWMERKARDSIVDLQLQKAVIVKSESFLPTSCVVDPILPTAPLLLPGTSTKVLPVVGYDQSSQQQEIYMI